MKLQIFVAIVLIVLFVYYFSARKNIYDKYYYFDYAGTTKPLPEVLKAYQDAANYGNLSQKYAAEGNEKLYEAEAVVKTPVPWAKTVVWTSGASEGNNTILKAYALYDWGFRPHFIIGNTEHHTTFACVDDLLRNKSVTVSYVDSRYPLAVKNAINERTVLVSVMHVNNETGIIHNIKSIQNIVNEARIRNPNIAFHSDIVQSYLKLPIPQVDMATTSAHKFHGPLGVGMIFLTRVPEQLKKNPLICGTQQNDLRGGTVNISGIVATGTAVKLHQKKNYSALKKQLLDGLAKHFNVMPITQLVGKDDTYFIPENPRILISPLLETDTVDNIIAFSVIKTGDLSKHFCNLELKDELLAKKIIIGTGSACAKRPSHVLVNMNLPFLFRCGFIRISIGAFTTPEDIEHLVKNLKAGILKQI